MYCLAIVAPGDAAVRMLDSEAKGFAASHPTGDGDPKSAEDHASRDGWRAFGKHEYAGGPRASALGCVGIQGSQANQAGAEIRYLRRLRLTIDGKTLFSQAFGLTVSPAGESGYESSVRLDYPPVGDFAARVMRNGLKGPLRGDGACSPDIELPGKHLAKKIGRDEFASRDLRYQGRYGRGTRQKHFSWTAKKF
jgi:hypothetical protein